MPQVGPSATPKILRDLQRSSIRESPPPPRAQSESHGTIPVPRRYRITRSEAVILFRFSLYGFLKNQRYFEPFLVLALLDRGLSFTEIGLCVAAREISPNAFEIPSGAIADVYGRRRSMVAAFVVYVAALGVFGLGASLWHFLAAMVMWGSGDAFRSGTHKAMILEWLRIEDRQADKVQVYGYTRSWSKIGSAVSAPIAAGVVWVTGSFSWVFWLAAVPYLANIANLATYPSALDGVRDRSAKSATSHVRDTAAHIWATASLRRLVLEGMAFQGTYAASKDFLQPVLQAAALTLPILVAVDDVQRTAVLVGAVYSALFAIAAVASRSAHRVATIGAEAASTRVWWIYGAALAALAAFLWADMAVGAIAIFVFLAALQNIFRPILISRFDDCSEPRFGATLLSVEAQAGSVATVILAPLSGAAVDSAGALWPVGAVGFAVALTVALYSRQRHAS